MNILAFDPNWPLKVSIFYMDLPSHTFSSLFRYGSLDESCKLLETLSLWHIIMAYLPFRTRNLDCLSFHRLSAARSWALPRKSWCALRHYTHPCVVWGLTWMRRFAHQSFGVPKSLNKSCLGLLCGWHSLGHWGAAVPCAETQTCSFLFPTVASSCFCHYL